MKNETGYDFGDEAPGVAKGEGMSIEEAAERARETDTEQYDTDLEWTDYGLEVMATRDFGKREVRCRIRLDTWTTGPPSVRFAYRHPGSEDGPFSGWSSTATGSLGGPQTLRRWMELCDVFQATLEILVGEISTEGVTFGQAEVFEHRTGDPHPVFDVNSSPERTPISEVDSE